MMPFSREFLNPKFIEPKRPKISNALENENTQDFLIDSDISSRNLNTEKLKGENSQYLLEDIKLKYKAQKKSVFIAYLLFFFTFTIISNFYVGRKRWAMTQLVGLLFILGSLIFLPNMDLPKTFYSWLDGTVVLLIGSVLFFDFCTLWYAVSKYNSKLFDSIFKESLKEHEKQQGDDLMKRQSESMSSTFHGLEGSFQIPHSASPIQKFNKLQ